jgi:hypothetical protein
LWKAEDDNHSNQLITTTMLSGKAEGMMKDQTIGKSHKRRVIDSVLVTDAIWASALK